jgi:hypothetical protein
MLLASPDVKGVFIRFFFRQPHALAMPVVYMLLA